MTRQAGSVSWASTTAERPLQREEVKKIPFLDMTGHNRTWKLRVISDEPLRYWCHFALDRNKKVVKVNCSLTKDCPVFVEKTKSYCGGEQAEARFYIKAIDRTDNKVKVLDIGRQIINAIGNLVENPEWGHCRGYDIILKKGSKDDRPLYTVAPSPHKDLTAADLELIANSENPEHEDYIDIQSRIQPLPVEMISKILKGGESNYSGHGSPSSGATATASGFGRETTTPSKPTEIHTKKTTSTADDAFEIDWGDEG